MRAGRQACRLCVDAGYAVWNVEYCRVGSGPKVGADHFDVIDPDHPAWQAVLDALGREFDSG